MGLWTAALQLSQTMGALLLFSFGYVWLRLKVKRGSDFYYKEISFACLRGSVSLCSPLLQHMISSPAWLEPRSMTFLAWMHQDLPARPMQQGGEDDAIKRLDNYFWKLTVYRSAWQLRWQHTCCKIFGNSTGLPFRYYLKRNVMKHWMVLFIVQGHVFGIWGNKTQILPFLQLLVEEAASRIPLIPLCGDPVQDPGTWPNTLFLTCSCTVLLPCPSPPTLRPWWEQKWEVNWAIQFV